jgi:hypothetical protein
MPCLATAPGWGYVGSHRDGPHSLDATSTVIFHSLCRTQLSGSTLGRSYVPTNELVLLDQILQQRQAERAEPLPDDRAFELLACENALRDFNLSTEEVEAGIVGGGNDGAIDGIYTFLGDEQLAEDSELFDEDYSAVKVSPGTRLVIWLIQAKRETGFAETAIDLVSSSTRRLLDLSESEDDLRLLYSDAVVERTGIFRTALQKLALRHPALEVRYTYVTRGETRNINTKVLAKARDLEQEFAGLLPDAEGVVEFVGSTELWKRINTLPSYTLKLQYQENATSGTSHVALVSLRDYVAFLTDDDGGLRRYIFDWNVRDYQGNVEVNREIEKSLTDTDSPEFWWLNNGVTIICSKTSIVGKTYILDDVQIVNGLQTSHTLFRVLHDIRSDHVALDRAVLVRILVTDDPSVRDAVIRATNSQTSVQPASLRATDEVQRTIEAFFLGKGWFYDRRKNYFRNLGKSPERIVSIPLLAQAVMAMGLSQPNNSRARPSSLLKRDDDYSTIFSGNVPLPVYLWLAKTQKQTDTFLSSEQTVSTQERTNLRFHFSMLAAARLVGERVYAPVQLAKIVEDQRTINEVDLQECLADLRAYHQAYATASGDPMDKIAKGSEFVEYIFKQPLSKS